jgi:hypothetical protein
VSPVCLIRAELSPKSGVDINLQSLILKIGVSLQFNSEKGQGDNLMASGKIQILAVCASGVALLLAVVPLAMSQDMDGQESEPASADFASGQSNNQEKSLDSLREEFYGAENDFYGLFNSINSSDDFDVDCRDEVPFGRKDKVHACKADFLRKYEAKLASFYSRRMSGVGAKSPPDADEVDAKQEQLRNEISAAISGNAEVQKSYARLVDAKRNYEARLQDQ